MRCIALLLCLPLVAGCTQRWGQSALPSAPPVDTSEAHLGDVEIQKLLALSHELETELVEVEAKLTGDADEQLRERRLLLVVALREVEAAIDARKGDLELRFLDEPSLPMWARADDPQSELMLLVVERVRLARDRLKAAAVAGGESQQGQGDDAKYKTPISQILGLPGGTSAAPPPVAGAKPEPVDAGEESADRGILDGLKERKPSPKKADKPAFGRFGKGRGEGKNRAAAVVVSDADTVDRTPEIRRHMGRFKACVPAGTVAGRTQVMIKAHVAGDGSFRSAQLQGADGLPAHVTACLKDTMHAIRVTPPEGGAIVVTFPLVLGN